MLAQGGQSGAKDRDSLALSNAANEEIKELRSRTPWFTDDAQVYRLAVAIALAKDLRPRSDESESGYTTKYGLQTVDPDGGMRVLVLSIVPEYAETPNRWISRLASKGVHYMHSELIGKGRPITEVLGIGEEGIGSDAV